MKHLFRSLAIILCGLIPVSSYGGYSGVWADNCKNGKDSFILSRNHDSGPYQVMFCSGFKCIPMPGMRKPTTLADDPAFKIVSENEIVLKEKTYFKCHEIQEAHFNPINHSDIKKYIIDNWEQVAQMSKGVEGPVKSYHYKNTQWNISNQSIVSSRNSKVNWNRDYKLKNDMLAIYNEGKLWRHYIILSISNERLYLSELERPSEAIRIFERK